MIPLVRKKIIQNILKEGLNLQKQDWEEITIPCANWVHDECKIRVDRTRNELNIDNVGIFTLKFFDDEYGSSNFKVFLDGKDAEIIGMNVNNEWTVGNWGWSITREGKDPFIALAQLIFNIY